MGIGVAGTVTGKFEVYDRTTAGNRGIKVLDTNITDHVFDAFGDNGTLFSVIDDLSDSLMSVNNAAGLPVFEVFADNTIVG